MNFFQQIKFNFLPILPSTSIWDIYLVVDSTLSKLEHIFERAHLERPLPLCRSFLGFLFIATSESRYHLVGKYIFKYRSSMEKQPHFLQEKKFYDHCSSRGVEVWVWWEKKQVSSAYRTTQKMRTNFVTKNIGSHFLWLENIVFNVI